jgi:hypothetical protein
MRRGLVLAALVLSLPGGCSSPGPDDGYVVYQTVFVDRGKPTERRLQVMEDARLTPGMRQVMWGGPKEPKEISGALGLADSDPVIAALAKDPVKPAMLRLTDAAGKVLTERRFDCALGELNDSPLPQTDGAATQPVWALGIDCHTATGLYEGLVTRFFTLGGDRFAWQKLRDPAGGDPIELTLLNSPKIGWHLASQPRVDDVLSVSGQPDMSHLDAKGVPQGMIVDLVRYHFAGGLWQRSDREMPGDWSRGEAFPPASAFPP